MENRIKSKAEVIEDAIEILKLACHVTNKNFQNIYSD